MRDTGVVNCRESDVLRPDRFCSHPRSVHSVRIGAMVSLTTRRDRKREWRSMFFIQIFRLECLTSGFARRCPTPALPTCMHLQGPSKTRHKHMPRAGSQEIGNGLLGNPPCHPLVQPSSPHIIYQRQSNCSKPTSFLVPKARSEGTKKGWAQLKGARVRLCVCGQEQRTRRACSWGVLVSSCPGFPSVWQGCDMSTRVQDTATSPGWACSPLPITCKSNSKHLRGCNSVVECVLNMRQTLG